VTIVAEHVEARAGRRKQHRVARLRLARRLRDRILERAATADRHASRGERALEQGSIAADQEHLLRELRYRQRERREVLSLAVAPGDEVHRLAQTAERRHRCAYVRAFRVVVPLDTAAGRDQL